MQNSQAKSAALPDPRILSCVVGRNAAPETSAPDPRAHEAALERSQPRGRRWRSRPSAPRASASAGSFAGELLARRQSGAWFRAKEGSSGRRDDARRERKRGAGAKGNGGFDRGALRVSPALSEVVVGPRGAGAALVLASDLGCVVRLTVSSIIHSTPGRACPGGVEHAGVSLPPACGPGSVLALPAPLRW